MNYETPCNPVPAADVPINLYSVAMIVSVLFFHLGMMAGGTAREGRM